MTTPDPTASISFEELADAGIDGHPPVDPPKRRPQSFGRLLVISLLAAAGGAAVWFVFLRPVAEPLPGAAKLLLEEDVENIGVLPHELDQATEFAESFDHLKPGAKAPAFRTIESIADIKAPAPEAADPLLDRGAVPSAQHPPSDMNVAAPAPVPAQGYAPAKPKIADTAGADQSTLAAVNPINPPNHSTATTPERIPLLNDSAAAKIEVQLDWEGIVLVPDAAKLARAYTSAVALTRVEAHPVDDGRLRVWARIRNRTEAPLPIAIGCEFRTQGREIERPHFMETVLAPGEAIDARFLSRQDKIHAYTILAKR